MQRARGKTWQSDHGKRQALQELDEQDLRKPWDSKRADCFDKLESDRLVLRSILARLVRVDFWCDC